MSQYVETPTKTFTASGALGQYLRVKTPSSLALAGATDVEIGTLEEAVFEASAPGTVRLNTAQGTTKMVASEAITAGAKVYAAASGKIASTGSVLIGLALEAASGDGSIIEVIRQPVHSTAQSVTPDDSESSLNTILPHVTSVDVDAVTNDANDFIVLPSLASVPIGHEITVVGNAGANFEVRTPAASNEEINSEDCDGTKEYLFADTTIHRFVKISDTVGWMGHGFTAIGAVVTAVVPD